MNKSPYFSVTIHNHISPGIKVSWDAAQSGWGGSITRPDNLHSSLIGLWGSSWSLKNMKALRTTLFASQYNTEKITNHVITFSLGDKASASWIKIDNSTRFDKTIVYPF